jgi:hypothetical protein
MRVSTIAMSVRAPGSAFGEAEPEPGCSHLDA